MTRLAIFDCDGTLVDSGGAIARALQRTFDEHGLAPPPPHVGRKVIGLSLNEAMAGLVPDAPPDEHAVLAERYKRHFGQMRIAGEVEEMLFPGIQEVLDELTADGWLLAVATGKSERGLRHCLEANGLGGRFISLQTADLHPSKPHPSMIEQALVDAGAARDHCLMIGDTSFDMEMAAAAGVIAVGVGWGYHDTDELVEAGAVIVADSPAELLAFAREQDFG